MIDPERYADLERYLLEDVQPRFEADGFLSAFDFFSIIIWKANRAKTHVARRLQRQDPKGRQQLDPIVRDLTVSLHRAADDQARIRILVEQWRFQLPMASAILTVLWPARFTIYDVRVCEQLGQFHELAACSQFARLWEGYQAYIAAVHDAVPGARTLRQKDRFLWGASVASQLRADIKRGFGNGAA